MRVLDLIGREFMLTKMLKAKLHMACITQAELWYDGSCAIDRDLVELAGMREFEHIDIYNVSNGERFSRRLTFRVGVLSGPPAQRGTYG